MLLLDALLPNHFRAYKNVSSVARGGGGGYSPPPHWPVNQNAEKEKYHVLALLKLFLAL